jgi:SAM-dependent methyltransferase
MELGTNYLFLLHFFDKYFEKEKSLSLDFGCGKGTFIEYAIEKGYKFRGVDNYYGSEIIPDFHKSPVNEFINILDASDNLPFEGKTFDFITSIQVFEHVKNLETVLSEIKRVLKDNGKVLCTFPFKHSIQEGHYGIPLSHWFKPESKFRKLWVRSFYKLGFGYNRKESLPFDKWCTFALNFIDDFCYYRTKKEFLRICISKGFLVINRNKDKILYQAQTKKRFIYKLISIVIKMSPVWFVSFLMNIKGSVCLELKKNIPD